MAKKKTKTFSLSEELVSAIEERAARTRVPASAEIEPVLEAHYGIRRKLQDKQLAGKLRK